MKLFFHTGADRLWWALESTQHINSCLDDGFRLNDDCKFNKKAGVISGFFCGYSFVRLRQKLCLDSF